MRKKNIQKIADMLPDQFYIFEYFDKKTRKFVMVKIIENNTALIISDVVERMNSANLNTFTLITDIQIKELKEKNTWIKFDGYEIINFYIIEFTTIQKFAEAQKKAREDAITQQQEQLARFKKTIKHIGLLPKE